ncbi:apurinic/apyrimidinic endonuclease-like protein [Trichoderma aethiopicum]
MPRLTRGSQKAIKLEQETDIKIIDSKPAKPAASASKRKADSPPDAEPDNAQPLVNGAPKEVQKLKKQRKAKVKVKAEGEEAMVLAERTVVSSLRRAMYIGAHVSAAGGVQNSVTNALHIGANSFALFLKSQRKWANPPMTPESQDGFVSGCKHHRYAANEHVLPHGSYLVNLAQADAAKAQQAYDSFVDDLARCERLGIRLYNFHPGSTGGEPKDAAIGRIAAQLNRAHRATQTVVTVLENMAGGGNVVGSTWEDLRDIIALVEDKTRVGVCIDTCHAFAAGYDLRTPEAFKKTVDSFNDIVGAKYLKAFHLNDSKAPLGSNRDLHANIGTGFLGLRAFHNVMNHPDFQDKPMVLETPIDKKSPDGKTVEDKQVWADEIKLLESLVGMDPDTKEFARLEAELQDKGADERRRIQEQVDKKASKGVKKKRGPKVKKEETSDEESG